LAGSSFYVHQLEQQGCKQSLSCSIKPPKIELTGVTTFLAEGVVILTRVLHFHLIWLVAEADRMERAAALTLTTVVYVSADVNG